MPLTFYTVHTGKRGYPVKYIQPQFDSAASYGEVQTFKDDEYPCGDPGEASQEFKACVGGQNACYLAPASFCAKVKALHQIRADHERKLREWNGKD